MVGFDVTYGGARAPGAFSHHYRWKPAIVHGAKGGRQRGGRVHPLFTRHPPYGGRQKKTGGHGVVIHHPGQGGRWRRLVLSKTTEICGASWLMGGRMPVKT